MKINEINKTGITSAAEIKNTESNPYRSSIHAVLTGPSTKPMLYKVKKAPRMRPVVSFFEIASINTSTFSHARASIVEYRMNSTRTMEGLFIRPNKKSVTTNDASNEIKLHFLPKNRMK